MHLPILTTLPPPALILFGFAVGAAASTALWMVIARPPRSRGRHERPLQLEPTPAYPATPPTARYDHAGHTSPTAYPTSPAAAVDAAADPGDGGPWGAWAGDWPPYPPDQPAWPDPRRQP